MTGKSGFRPRLACLATILCLQGSIQRTASATACGSVAGNYGYSVAGVGDVNGDGVADFAVGFPCDSPEGRLTGSASFRGSVKLHDGRTGATLRRIEGERMHEMFGVALAGLGDVDGDAAGDFAVGSVLGGVVRVYSGATGSVLHRLQGTPPQRGELIGFSLAAVSDLDRDGVRDLLVGAPRRAALDGDPALRGEGKGGAYLFSGCSGALLRTFGVELPASAAPRGWWFGRRVAGAGDVDGDGVEDLAVASCGHALFDLDGREREPGGARKLFDVPQELREVLEWMRPEVRRAGEVGRVWVFSGSTGVPIRQLTGESAGDGFGCALTSMGDLDGDGRAELAVGAFAARGTGCVELFDGASGRRLRTAQGDGVAREFGYTLANAGDWDGDGHSELAVGDPCADRGGNRFGRVTLLSGCDASAITLLEEGGPDLNVSDYGFSIAAIGSGDSSPSLAVGTLNSGWFGMAFTYARDEGVAVRKVHLDLDGIYGQPSK